MDSFEENNVGFLDITICKTDTDLYYKPTHKGKISRIKNDFIILQGKYLRK